MAGQDLNGMWDPSEWISKANERSYTDTQGQRQSYNRGTKWQDYINKKLYGNDEAKNYFYSELKRAIDMDLDDKGLKQQLRFIEDNLKKKYKIGLDISHTMTDRQMAKMLREIYPRAQKPADTPQQTQQVPQKPTTPEGAKGKQVENTNKGVAQAQPGDWIMRSNGQPHVLTMEDIKWAYKKVYGREYGTTQTPEQAAEQQKAMDAVRAQQSTPGTAQQRSTAAQQAAGASQAKQAAEQHSTEQKKTPQKSGSQIAGDEQKKLDFEAQQAAKKQSTTEATYGTGGKTPSTTVSAYGTGGKKPAISKDKLEAAKNYVAPEG